MDKSRLLWLLIAADILLAFGSAGAEAFFGWTLPSALSDHRDSQGVGALRILLLGITTASAFTAWIGLACFWRMAREIYLFAAACGVALALFSGPQVSTSVAAAFTLLNGLASGAILGLVYFSDLARRFERNPDAQPAPAGVLGAQRG